jgi:hypothetical protein
VRYLGDPRYFVFFPGDIAAAMDNDIPPLWPDGFPYPLAGGKSPWCVS